MVSTSTFIKQYLNDIDAIGSDDYMGMASFWNPEYKHTLRSACREARKRIHDLLIDNGLQLDGKSEKHDEIIYNSENLSN